MVFISIKLYFTIAQFVIFIIFLVEARKPIVSTKLGLIKGNQHKYNGEKVMQCYLVILVNSLLYEKNYRIFKMFIQNLYDF